MKNLSSITRKLATYAAISLPAVILLVSCNPKSDNIKPPIEYPIITVPALSEIQGGWEALGFRWDLNEGKSACYLMNGDDFAYDENGDYISITIREFCEQYAADYNADPKNTTKGTAEDFANQSFEGTYSFVNFNITADKFIVYTGQRIPDVGTMSVLGISGAYTFDATKGIFTVNDVAIESDPRTIEVKVWKETDEKGASTMYIQYTDFEIYTYKSYDQTKEYWITAPMIHEVIPGEPYIPSDKAPQPSRIINNRHLINR